MKRRNRESLIITGFSLLCAKIGKSTATDGAAGKTNVYGASENMYIIPYTSIDMIDGVLQRQNSPLTMYIHFGYTIIERG